MTMRRPSLLLPALIAAVLLPACGDNDILNPPSVAAARIQITIEPSPVVAAQNPINFGVSASYRIIITELEGLGGELVFVTGSVYDPATGRLVAQNFFDTRDLIVFVGQSRIEPLGNVSFTQSSTYTLPDLSKAAVLTVSAQLRDDRGNTINTSTLANIQ